MLPTFNITKARVLALAGLLDLTLVASQSSSAVSTITDATALYTGTPNSEVTASLTPTATINLHVPEGEFVPSVSSGTPTLSIPDNVTTTVPSSCLTQPFGLPTQPAVITQAPCVSACLQARLIAYAAGPCGHSAGAAIDNACACLSAPLVVVQAIANCATAACTGLAAGEAGMTRDVAAVTSLYNEYCLSAVGAGALGSAVSGEGGNRVTTTTGGGSSGGMTTAALGTSNNGTFGGAATPTSTQTLGDAGATTATATTTSGGDAGAKSEAGLDVPQISDM
jgi:hypothetical protein